MKSAIRIVYNDSNGARVPAYNKKHFKRRFLIYEKSIYLPDQVRSRRKRIT